MARTVSVGEFQQQQRGGSKPAPGFRAPALTVAEQLAALTLEDDIAGMPLGQVVGLVRLAVEAYHVNATEPEIRAEAERRWLDAKLEDPKRNDSAGVRSDENAGDGSKDQNARSGDSQGVQGDGRRCAHGVLGLHGICTSCGDVVAEQAGEDLAERMADRAEGAVAAMAKARVVDVGPDGIVEAVRPAEMTPDRGDVTVHHTVTDDTDAAIRAFNRSDAEIDEDWEPKASALIPTDQQFAGRLYRDAPELANIAERLIGEHGHLADLVNCEIRYFWRRKTGVSKGRVKIGYCKRASDLLGHFTGCDFIIWLSATTARDGKFTDRQVEAAVFHQLCHIETDDEGNFISARHDFEGFAAEVRHYGTWTADLKLGGTAFVAAHQMGLFDDEGIEDDEDDDLEDEREEAARAGYAETPDGAGILIHADGTPMTAGEIEAMERRELDDEPADPDGPSPEDDDILADAKVI